MLHRHDQTRAEFQAAVTKERTYARTGSTKASMERELLLAAMEECVEARHCLAGIRFRLAELWTVADELERDAMADERPFHDVPPRLREVKLRTEDVSDTLQDLQPSIDRIVALRKACREEEKSLASPNARAAT